MVHPKEAIQKIGLVQQQIKFKTKIKLNNLPNAVIEKNQSLINHICYLFQKCGLLYLLKNTYFIKF